MSSNRPRPANTRAEHQDMLQKFLMAVALGDASDFAALLAEDVVARSDGGGVVNAARKPIVGPDNVVRFFLGVAKKFPPTSIAFMDLNGRPAFASLRDGVVESVVQLDVSEGRITEIHVVRNPHKLARLGSP